jgi:hypothetical protein
MSAYQLLHSILDYECLLFHCEEWRTKNLSRMNSAECSHVSSFYNLGRNEYRSLFPTVRVIACLFVVNGNVCCDFLPSNEGPTTVDCVTF